MTAVRTQIEQNYRDLLARIETACQRAGRSPQDVAFVAVTKYAELDWVQALVELGVRDLGESRPQQLVERAGQTAAAVRWHLVGHLQRNKARRILPLVSLIHSVDTLRLLETLDRLAAEQGLRPRVLLEVNISGEEQKHGLSPDDLLADWDRMRACPTVEIEGLMTMAPLSEDPEQARPLFRQLRDLRDRLAARSPGSISLPHLSMGMSGDFEVAIEEGATLVRIGTQLFDGLTK